MEAMLPKIALVIAGLILVGVTLTAYEFREHIIKHFHRKKHIHKDNDLGPN